MTALIAFWYALGFVSGATATRYYMSKGHPMIAKIKRTLWQGVRTHVVALALAGFILGMLAVGGFVILYVHSNTQTNNTVEQIHRTANCQGIYAQALNMALQKRQDATRAAVLAPRRFFRELLPDLLRKDPTPAQQRKALVDLITANQETNDAYNTYLHSQLSNPLPPAPDQFCSDGGSKHQ